MDYIFTEHGFYADGEGCLSYKELYESAFREKEKESLSADFLYSIASFFLQNLLGSTGLELKRENVEIEYDDEEIRELAEKVPPAIGSEYVNSTWIKRQLKELFKIYFSEIKDFSGSVDLYLNSKSESLSAPLRIYFHLVENPKGKKPFAFMATYSTKNNKGEIKHYPLRYALYEYKDNIEGLSRLVSPLSSLSRKSKLIASLISSGKIFHPVSFSSKEAYSYLKEVELYEEEGIVCRIPQFWKRRGKGTSVSVNIGIKTRLDASAILEIKPSLVYEGIKITKKELEELLAQSEGLMELKGKWVELDKKKLEKLRDSFLLFDEDITLNDVIKYSTGMKKSPAPIKFSSSAWLSDAFKILFRSYEVPSSLKAELRGYQKDGFSYLSAMKELSLGLCLADDMGLGKTVQVLSYLLREKECALKKALLIVPSSLIGNWESEIRKFSPSLDYSIYHGKERSLSDSFLTITTYATASRDGDILRETEWDEIILDEAQNIKNAGTKQTKVIMSLPKKHGIVLTGTPIENNLLNLWTLMDFSNSGLLGDKSAFSRYAKALKADDMPRFKAAIKPFVLRRLKTDKKIISDLPDKVETDCYANLTKEQIVLYEKITSSLELGDGNEGEKKIKVLAAIMKLKQICNHPDQFNGVGSYLEKESGKFALLRQIATNIYESREKVLVFTQFVEIIPALNTLLSEIFKKEGAIIDGSISAKKRTEIVKDFQSGKYPYLVLSLRAAGVGLNLTEAQNVIHFDRWWNPAVENQATDRAFRIGQKKRVMVYKFITRGTIEEKIDEIIKEKANLVKEVLGDTSSDILKTLTSDELLEAMKFSREVL